MERKSFENGDHSNFLSPFSTNVFDTENEDKEEVNRLSPERPRSQILSSNRIEHEVSKMDTLAGVAIKYGVEVADIKRMNGLVTDLQMFGLKTLQIPLPGRHPPSPNLPNGLDGQGLVISEQTPPRHRHSDLFNSFQALKPKSSPQRVSPAMSSLQGYYGTKPVEQRRVSEGFEMAVYRRGGSHCLEDDQFAQSSSPFSNPPPSLGRKSKSIANSLSCENGSNNLGARIVFRERWGKKSELDPSSPTPVVLMEDNNSNESGFSAITGKGLALRPKSASRTASGVESESEKLKPNPIDMGDYVVVDSFSGVRKSSSTPSLQDQERCASSTTTSSSIWPTSKWSLKPDLQALSSVAITRPFFDGLPKPITGRKSKAALD